MAFLKPLLAVCATAFALSSPLPAAANHDGVKVGDLTIEHAYARASAHSGAVFMVIVNHSDTDDRLVAASVADVAKMAELHTHTEDANGVMQMPEVPEGFVIPAKGEHALERGGDHIMLMGLNRDLETGAKVSVTLTFEIAGDVTIEVPVDNDRTAAGGEAGHAGHSHDHASAPVDTTGMTDPEAVAAVMKAQFDTPENPLSVDPVTVEGDHALASWAQGDMGGRALLERRDGQWAIVLCGGPDLRLPSFLAQHGVTTPESISALFNASEDGLGADKVALFSSFQGVVMISGPDQGN